MPDLVKMLRDLADAYERESKGEESKALQDRIDSLESKVKETSRKATVSEREEAFEEISDEEMELIRQHRAGTTAPPVAVAGGSTGGSTGGSATKTRPGRKKGQAYQWTVDEKGAVQKTDIAHIYSGEDEPDEVAIEEPAADAA